MNVCRHAEEGVASVKEEGTMNTQRSNTGPLVARIVKNRSIRRIGRSDYCGHGAYQPAVERQ